MQLSRRGSSHVKTSESPVPTLLDTCSSLLCTAASQPQFSLFLSTQRILVPRSNESLLARPVREYRKVLGVESLCLSLSDHPPPIALAVLRCIFPNPVRLYREESELRNRKPLSSHKSQGCPEASVCLPGFSPSKESSLCLCLHPRSPSVADVYAVLVGLLSESERLCGVFLSLRSRMDCFGTIRKSASCVGPGLIPSEYTRDHLHTSTHCDSFLSLSRFSF